MAKQEFKGKVRLMDKFHQLVQLTSMSLPITIDIVNVWEDNKGRQVGRVRGTGERVLLDKKSRVWRSLEAA